MRFRPDEYAVCNVEAETAAYVDQKVIAALEIGAAGETAGEEWCVKPEALRTDPALQFGLCSLAQRGTIYRVEIVEDRPVRVEEDIHVLVATPCHFPADSEILLVKKEVAAECRVPSTPNALRSMIIEIGKGIGGRLACHSSHPESQIKLLPVDYGTAEYKQAKGRHQE